jgi:hypothetical protein
MSESNPFPTYQTVNLTDSPEQVHKRTVETPEIGRARKLLEEYEKHFGAEVSKIPHRPILVAVAGDYGTGKTHLLMEVASQFNKLKAFDGIILSWIAPEDTPSAWFRAQPNPLNNVPFEAIMEAVFNQVAIKVAQSSKLTRKHADEIKEDPEVLSDLFAAGKINFSVVDEAYHKEMSKMRSLRWRRTQARTLLDRGSRALQSWRTIELTSVLSRPVQATMKFIQYS